jgi:hypothetical protein
VLYLADYPEAVTFIKGNVSRIRAFEVSRDAVLVASSKSMFHQQRAEPLADPARISGNEGQIPMWFVGMMFGHSLEYVSNVIGDLWTPGLGHDCAHGRFIGLNAGSSGAQSVILMALVIGLTMLQFRYAEKKVTYR